jgi:UDP-galactopyranose mutase
MLNLDCVCLSHLRWDFVYQRPQHLLSRFARDRRVFFIEEPIVLPAGSTRSRLDISHPIPGLSVVVPRLPEGVAGLAADQMQRSLLARLFDHERIEDFVLWYYTPMAVSLTRDLPAAAVTVYDCMDELSAFHGAPPELVLREAELLQCADLVFTGGRSLYEAKRSHHPHVYPFPSGVDGEHFAQARRPQVDPEDQATLRRPRFGFYGVLDERLDTELIERVADLRPQWEFVLVGPVAKIDPASLPRRPNLHYLGPKTYVELPTYLAGWDVALIPFARNQATRFISPTKTPEYLAAGRPVVSTSIRDVVEPYEGQRLVWIADSPDEFVAAAEAAMRDDAVARQSRADAFLATMSWDTTWAAMDRLVAEHAARHPQLAAAGAVHAA